MTTPTQGEHAQTEALDDLYLKLHGMSKRLESSGRIDESDAPEAYPAILDAMNLVRRLQCESAQVAALTPAQPAERMPLWMQYDERNDVLTIHSKRYAAAMFGQDGFLAPVGTLLRVEAGDPDCVTLHKVTAAPQCVAEVNWWEADGDKYDASISPMQPAQGVAYAELPKDLIRAVFIENGFTVKEGQTDLKQYVYDAAIELLRRARLRAPNGQAPATQQVGVVRKIDRGFRWDGENLQHVPTLLLEFEPVPANSPCDAKGWQDRDAVADRLSSPTAQAAPAATDFTTLDAAMRAIQQAIGLIGEPADERMQTIKRVLRGAVIVAEDSGEMAAPAAGAVAGLTREQIRDVFLANGFTVKEGQRDLKPYVYAAAEALLAQDRLSAQVAALTASPAQPAAPQGVAYADAHGAIMGAAYDFLDAHISGSPNQKCSAHAALESAVTHALRASHGQAPAGTTEPTEQQILEAAFAPAQPAAEASRFGSPELQAMIIARCVEKDQADSVPAVEREQERIAFKDAHRHLELDEVPDAWGRPMFKHSHIEASWLGWIARAPNGQAPATQQAGWKLVPMVPTAAMVDAGCPVGEMVDHFDMATAYRSMLAAAPQPSPTAQAAESQPAEDESYKQALWSKNCMQCCVSYMLGLPLESVPDFATDGCWELFSEFVESKGYAAVMLPGNSEFEADYLASGTTARGTSHMVVMNDGKLVHDPHPSNAGLVEVQCVWLLAKKSGPQWHHDERAAFEASAKAYTSNVSFERDGTDYADMTASLLWHGWKLRAARAQADSVLEDAARYRWLRRPHLAAGHGSISVVLDDRANGNMSRTIWLDRLDAVIDAARKQGGA